MRESHSGGRRDWQGAVETTAGISDRLPQRPLTLPQCARRPKPGPRAHNRHKHGAIHSNNTKVRTTATHNGGNSRQRLRLPQPPNNSKTPSHQQLWQQSSTTATAQPQPTKRAKMGTKYMNISESCSRAGRAYAAMHSNIPTDTTNGATTPRQRRRRPRTTTHHVHIPEPTCQPAKTRDSHTRTRAQEHR